MGAWVLDVKSLDDGQLWSITGSPQTLYLVSVLFCNHPLGRKQSLLLNGLRCSAIQIQLACFVHYTLPIISIKLRERLRKGFGKSDHKDLDQTLGLPWCLNCNDILNCPTLTGASPVPVRPKCSSGQGCWVGLVNLCGLHMGSFGVPTGFRCAVTNRTVRVFLSSPEIVLVSRFWLCEWRISACCQSGTGRSLSPGCQWKTNDFYSRW